MKPGDLLIKLLADNNLKVYLSKSEVRQMEDGALLVEKPTLMVDWVVQPAVETPDVDPIPDVTPVPTAPVETTVETPQESEVTVDEQPTTETTD